MDIFQDSYLNYQEVLYKLPVPPSH